MSLPPLLKMGLLPIISRLKEGELEAYDADVARLIGSLEIVDEKAFTDFVVKYHLENNVMFQEIAAHFHQPEEPDPYPDRLASTGE